MLSRSLVALPLSLLACASAPSPRPSTTAPAATSVPAVRAPSRPGAAATSPSTARTLRVLFTSDPNTTYCDGERMDSAAYRKTLTVEKPLALPPAGASDTEVVRAVLGAVTHGTCSAALQQLDYRIERGVLHIPPIDAWAGISIAMCTCLPEIEVNAVRIPGVTTVRWDREDGR